MLRRILKFCAQDTVEIPISADNIILDEAKVTVEDGKIVLSYFAMCEKQIDAEDKQDYKAQLVNFGLEDYELEITEIENDKT